MKNLLFLVLLINNSYALAISLSSNQNIYANIYADFLIDAYDTRLSIATSHDDAVLMDLYSKILAARDILEHEGSIKSMSTYSVVEIVDSDEFSSIVAKVHKRSSEIAFDIKVIRDKQMLEPVIYPSLGATGNLTGNTFPKHIWSLTFDDGPHAFRTNSVVDNLHFYDMKATFFMLMKQVNSYPKALEYVLSNDMELALHSYNHLNLVKHDPDTVLYEIATAKKELEEVSNQSISLFRLPYGSGMRNNDLRLVIANEKMLHIFWNVDTLDWKDKDPQSIFERTTRLMKLTPNQSGIILFHDIHPQTVIASKMVMEFLKENDKTVCLLDEIVKYHNGIDQDCL